MSFVLASIGRPSEIDDFYALPWPVERDHGKEYRRYSPSYERFPANDASIDLLNTNDWILRVVEERVKYVLDDWNRVMASNGTMIITIPNLLVIAEGYPELRIKTKEVSDILYQSVEGGSGSVDGIKRILDRVDIDKLLVNAGFVQGTITREGPYMTIRALAKNK